MVVSTQKTNVVIDPLFLCFDYIMFTDPQYCNFETVIERGVQTWHLIVWMGLEQIGLFQSAS